MQKVQVNHNREEKEEDIEEHQENLTPASALLARVEGSSIHTGGAKST